jgi:hypothetical protein
MSQWLKSIQDKLGKATPDEPKPVSFRERIEEEQERQREQQKIAMQRRTGNRTPMMGHSAESATVEDKRVLATMLSWKLDIKADYNTFAGNPAKIDGYWFGVKRYWKFARHEGEEEEQSYKLHFYRRCDHCRALVPTIELGDYLEIKEAARRQAIEGEEVTVTKSTTRLAAYLNDLDSGRSDPFCPRMCPSCKKLIKGGTL